MERLFTRQYEGVQGARGVLLDYCETLAPEDFTRELKDFGRGSIRNLLVHTVNTYRYWLELFARNQPVDFHEPGAVRGKAAEARRLFAHADAAVRGVHPVLPEAYERPSRRTAGQTVTQRRDAVYARGHARIHHKGKSSP
jgi:uncharacterized damage-inducible protein DinB